MAKPKPTQKENEIRFWSKVDKNGPIHPILKTPCWLWKGTLSNNNYGSFGVNGKTVSPHRYSYELEFGKLPNRNVLACHHCDNSLCVNPSHLYAGSHQTNMIDAMEREQWHCPSRPVGEKNPAAKLNESQVLEIRELLRLNTKQKMIATRFNISIHLVRKIAYRHVWSHI